MPFENSIKMPLSDRSLYGIGMMVLAFFFMSLVDACAKWLSADYSIGQILFIRALITIFPLILFIKLRHSWGAFIPTRPVLTIMRSVAYFITGYLFFFSLRFLGLAEATVLMFVSPFLITALSVFILKERVGWQRWAAIAVGFSGVYVAIDPKFDNFSYAALLPIAAAFTYSMASVLTRLLSRSQNNAILIFYPQIIAILLSGMTFVFGWTPLSLLDFGVIVIMAILQLIVGYLLVQSFRYAEAAVVAPFEYSALVWSTLLGWFIFQEWPENRVWLGAAILIACGVFIIYRETKVRRMPSAPLTTDASEMRPGDLEKS